MKLHGRPLALNMTGNDVALLHAELQKLGFNLLQAEVEQRRVGKRRAAQFRSSNDCMTSP